MKPSSAKAKGRDLQKLCRDKLISLLSSYGIEPDDIKSTAMGQSGEDIQLSPKARSLLPVSIECKSHKAMAIYSLYEQAEQYKEKGEPVLVVKANRKKPLAVVDLDYYLRLEAERITNEHKTDT